MSGKLEELEKFSQFVSSNNIIGCREIFEASSNQKKIDLVNSNVKRRKTSLHFAAGPKVSADIWKLILPYASDVNLYAEMGSLQKLIPYADEDQNRSIYNIGFTWPIHQLTKIRSWLEKTKCVTSNNVVTYRSHFLCKLCRLKGSDDSKSAAISCQDIFNLSKDLIEHFKADPNGYDNEYRPLLWAMETSNLPLLAMFLSHGADPNCRDKYNNTPLLYTRSLQGSDERVQIVGMLIRHGALVDTTDGNGIFTAFHMLLVVLRPEEIDILMKKHLYTHKFESKKPLPLPPIIGMMINSFSYSRYSMDTSIMQSDMIDKVKVLNRYELQLDKTDLHGRTILHYASWFRLATFVKYLLDIGFQISATDTFGRTCLHYSVMHPSTNYKIENEVEEISVLKILINHMNHRELEITDQIGRHVQHLCIFENNTRALQYLSSHGLQMIIADRDGLSLEDYDKRVKDISECIIIYERTTSKSNNGKEFVNFLLNDPTYGQLKENDIEGKIIEDVSKLVERISHQLNTIDKRFYSHIQLAGSMSEKTKTRPLDEFDFQFQLHFFSPLFCFDSLSAANEVTLKTVERNNMDIRDIWENLDSDETMNLRIFAKFNSYIFLILNSQEFWTDMPFYWNYLPVVKSPEWVRNNIVSGSLIVPLCLKWIGRKHCDINISVDLVPVLTMEKLDNSVIESFPAAISEFVRRKEFKWHVIFRNSTYARFSFLNVERWIVNRLASEVRDAYKITKSLRSYLSSTTNFDFDIITSYMLKNALLFELDPLLSYGILNEQLVCLNVYSLTHKSMLQMMRQNLDFSLNDRTSFIQMWALKILDRLEKWFLTDECAFVYCRPKVKFPDYFEVFDEQKNHPYLKALRHMKERLKNSRRNSH